MQSTDEKRPTILNEDGHEIHPQDVGPVAIPLRFRVQDTIAQQVQRLVQYELSLYADAQGFETFDEADDFDVGDDYDPRSPYELDEGHETYDRNAGWNEAEASFVRERIARPKEKTQRGGSTGEEGGKGDK